MEDHSKYASNDQKQEDNTEQYEILKIKHNTQIQWTDQLLARHAVTQSIAFQKAAG